MDYKGKFLLMRDVFGLKSKLAEIVSTYKPVINEK